MKPTKELITRIKKLRDTDGLNFREISEHLKIVDNLDITRQSAERIYKTNPDVKVWSKWSLFANQWKKEIEAGASINQVAKEYGVRPKVVWYQMKKIGVVSTAKSGPKFKKKEGSKVDIIRDNKLFEELQAAQGKTEKEIWDTLFNLDFTTKNPLVPVLAGGLDHISFTKKAITVHDRGCNGRDRSFKICKELEK